MDLFEQVDLPLEEIKEANAEDLLKLAVEVLPYIRKFVERYFPNATVILHKFFYNPHGILLEYMVSSPPIISLSVKVLITDEPTKLLQDFYEWERGD